MTADRVVEADGPAGRGPSPRRRFTFEPAARSHTGLVREGNEDFVFAGANLIAVADGVGGNVFGEIASELVVAAISYLDDRIYLTDPEGEVREAAEYANARLVAAIQKDPTLLGMATTLTALRLDGGSVVVLNIGDSRAYRVRDGRFEPLTRDDSVVQDLLDAGEITDEEALVHPLRSVVLQSLSGGPLQPTIAAHEVLESDRFLVCSDGLTDYVPEADVARIVTTGPTPDECCAALIEATLAAGAPDNVSCVVADVRCTVAPPTRPG
jgi:serine/threonine protein phosphatase PrpC